jgi:polyphosphate kinase 2 (PPK2 family)
LVQPSERRADDGLLHGEYESFLQNVVPFEHMLIGAGIQIVKYYLDISKSRRSGFGTGGTIR